MKKRIVSILLVAAMSVSLFACGSKESSSSSDDSKKDSSASTSTHMNASDADGIYIRSSCDWWKCFWIYCDTGSI